MMNEVTWHEHCKNLEVQDNSPLVCRNCGTKIVVQEIFTILQKWAATEYRVTGRGMDIEDYFYSFARPPESYCEHLRYLGFLDSCVTNVIDKDGLGDEFVKDPKFEEERTKEMQEGTDYSVFREWLISNEGGIMVDLSTYWEIWQRTDTKGTYHDIKDAGLVAIFQDVSVLG